jgi:hypothetical protein
VFKVGANNKRLTIEEVKDKLLIINKDIIILDDIYIGSKTPMNCKCLICDEGFSKSWNDLSQGKSCPACAKNGIKITKDEIRELVGKYGYIVVEFLPYDAHKGTMFALRCSEGHEYITGYREFIREETKRHGSCKQCNQNRIGSSARKDANEVMSNIIAWGYTVEGEFDYRNSRQILTFICKNGHQREISYHSLERTPICPECNGRLRHSEENTSELLEGLGLKYVSGFVHPSIPFNYICSCGNKDSKSLRAIFTGSRCNDCLERRQWTFEEVKEFYFNNQCELLENEYINNKQVLKFICNCGNQSQKPFYAFINCPKCGECGSKKPTGENHPNWNPNLTEEERENKRKFYGYVQWRDEVYKRDNYTCQVCGDSRGGNLNAHHKDSYDWCVDRRLDIDNGVTLCEDCHLDFHMENGYGDNTEEQFIQWFNINTAYLHNAQV